MPVTEPQTQKADFGKFPFLVRGDEVSYDAITRAAFIDLVSQNLLAAAFREYPGRILKAVELFVPLDFKKQGVPLSVATLTAIEEALGDRAPASVPEVLTAYKWRERLRSDTMWCSEWAREWNAIGPVWKKDWEDRCRWYCEGMPHSAVGIVYLILQMENLSQPWEEPRLGWTEKLVRACDLNEALVVPLAKFVTGPDASPHIGRKRAVTLQEPLRQHPLSYQKVTRVLSEYLSKSDFVRLWLTNDAAWLVDMLDSLPPTAPEQAQALDAIQTYKEISLTLAFWHASASRSWHSALTRHLLQRIKTDSSLGSALSRTDELRNSFIKCTLQEDAAALPEWLVPVASRPAFVEAYCRCREEVARPLGADEVVSLVQWLADPSRASKSGQPKAPLNLVRMANALPLEELQRMEPGLVANVAALVTSDDSCPRVVGLAVLGLIVGSQREKVPDPWMQKFVKCLDTMETGDRQVLAKKFVAHCFSSPDSKFKPLFSQSFSDGTSPGQKLILQMAKQQDPGPKTLRQPPPPSSPLPQRLTIAHFPDIEPPASPLSPPADELKPVEVVVKEEALPPPPPPPPAPPQQAQVSTPSPDPAPEKPEVVRSRPPSRSLSDVLKKKGAGVLPAPAPSGNSDLSRDLKPVRQIPVRAPLPLGKSTVDVENVSSMVEVPPQQNREPDERKDEPVFEGLPPPRRQIETSPESPPPPPPPRLPRPLVPAAFPPSDHPARTEPTDEEGIPDEPLEESKSLPVQPATPKRLARPAARLHIRPAPVPVVRPSDHWEDEEPLIDEVAPEPVVSREPQDAPEIIDRRIPPQVAIPMPARRPPPSQGDDPDSHQKKPADSKLLWGSVLVVVMALAAWAATQWGPSTPPKPDPAMAELQAWQNKVSDARTYNEVSALRSALASSTLVSKQGLDEQLLRKQSDLETAFRQTVAAVKSSTELDDLVKSFGTVTADSELGQLISSQHRTINMPTEAEKVVISEVKTLLKAGSIEEASNMLANYKGPRSAEEGWDDLNAQLTNAMGKWNQVRASTVLPALAALENAAGEGDVKSATVARKTLRELLPEYGHQITKLAIARKMTTGETSGWLDEQVTQAEKNQGTKLLSALMNKARKAMEAGRLSELDDALAQIASMPGSAPPLTASQKEEVSRLSAFRLEVESILSDLTKKLPLQPQFLKHAEAVAAQTPREWLSWAVQTRELIQSGDYMGGLQTFARNPLPKDPAEIPDPAWQKLADSLDEIVTNAVGADLKKKGREYANPSEYAPVGTKAGTIPGVTLKVQQALASDSKLKARVSTIKTDGTWSPATQNAVLQAQHILLPARQADGRLNDDLLDLLGVQGMPARASLGETIAKARTAIDEGRIDEAEFLLSSSISQDAPADEKKAIAELKDLSGQIKSIVHTLETETHVGPEILGRIQKMKGGASQAWLLWAGQTRELINSGDYMAALEVFNGKNQLEADGPGPSDPVWKNLSTITDAAVKDAVGPYLKKFGKEFDDPDEYAPKGTRAREIETVIRKVQRAIASHPRLKDLKIGDVKLAEISLDGNWDAQVQNAVIRAQHILLPSTQADGRLNDNLIGVLGIDASPQSQSADPANLAELFTSSPYSGSPQKVQSNILGQAQKKMGINNDGDFGPKTLKYLKEYQKENALAVTGRLDEGTLKSMGITGVEDKPEKPERTVVRSDPPAKKKGADGESRNSRPPSSSDNGINPKMDPYSGYLRQNTTVADTVARWLNRKTNDAVKQALGRDGQPEPAGTTKKKAK